MPAPPRALESSELWQAGLAPPFPVPAGDPDNRGHIAGWAAQLRVRPRIMAGEESMFSILISANGTSWETDQLMRSDVDRFKENGGSEATAVSLEDSGSLKLLEKAPVLLMYEWATKDGPNPDLVRYGFARDISQSGRDVVFRFEEHGHLSKSDIAEFADRLGIGKWEMNRTHWAIKDGGIPSALLSKMTRLHVGERQVLTVFYCLAK
jgi:hypothetical protein